MYYQGNALKKRKSRFRLTVCCICIVLLACIIEAWGHDTPRIRSGASTHTLSRVWSDGEGHWHEDADGRGAGAWDQCVADAYDPETDSYDLRGGRCAEESLPPPPPPTTPPRRTRRSTSTSTTTEAIKETLDEVVESPAYEPKPKPPRKLLPEPEPEPEPVVLESHEWKLFAGYTLIGFPIQVFDDEHGNYQSEVEDFYHDSNVFDSPTEGILEHIKVEEVCPEWWFYQGEGLLGNFPTVGNHGVVVRLDEAETVELEGIANYSRTSVKIQEGWNVIGLPEVPLLYKRPSDFLSDAICLVLVTDETGFRSIGRADDPGDNPLYPGQAVLLQATTELRLDLSGDTLAAPSIRRSVGNMTTTWGAMKAR